MENDFSLSSAIFQQNNIQASTLKTWKPSQWIQQRTVASTVIHLFEGNMCCQTSISGPNTPIILNAKLWKTESKNEMRNKR